MNVFLINTDGGVYSVLRQGRSALKLLSAMGEEKNVCLLTGYGAMKENGDALSSVFSSAELVPVHLLKACGRGDGEREFADICERVEQLIERMTFGSLARFESIIAAIPGVLIKAFLQNAFRMDIPAAFSTTPRVDAVRVLSLTGHYFYDLGYFTDGEDSASCAAASSDGVAQGSEGEREVEKQQIINYYEAVEVRVDTVRFVEDMNKKLNRICKTVEENRILWGNEIFDPYKSYAADNDLILFCALMREAIHAMNERSLKTSRELDNSFGLSEGAENEICGIIPEKSNSPSMQQDGHGRSQNSK